MANQYISKVVLGTETLIDLTDSTVTPATLMLGTVAYGADGSRLVGTATGGDEGSAYQDEDGYIVLGEGESSAPQGNVSITANGTYDVASYAGANVEVPVGMSETELKNFISRSSTFTDIDWPDGLTTIGSYAFASCGYFAPSSLPSGIRVINDYAFYYCSRLALTSLPSGVTGIGQYAFRSCANLALTSLPSGLIGLGNHAFQLCNSLALTDLPSGITSVGVGVFAGCSSLLTMDLSGVTSIGSNSFQNCTSLTTVTLSSELRNIDAYAFSGCSLLVVSTLPDSLTSIGNGAFCNCESIASISCEGTITTLAGSVFNGNSTHPMALTSASFPNMALAASISAVFGSATAANACQLLEFCDIGSTTGIASNAFANCYALETLVLRKTASVCTLANVNAFTNTPMSGYNNLTGKVYVPSALIESYKTATNWATLYNAGTVEFLAIEGSEYERD